MAKRKAKHITAQGVELIDLAIASVRRDPRPIAGFCGDYPLVEPCPLPAPVLERLNFPSGKPLPPSLKRWLAFDASWLQSLGWFSSLEEPTFTPRTLGQIADAEFGPRWRGVTVIAGLPADPAGDLNFYAPLDPLFPECFLLPEGTDSRRIFAVTEPDDLGEYPVLVIDEDDVPYAAIMYPGFDVYMADLAGTLGLDFDTYESLHEDERYVARLALHARRLFGGKPSIELMDPEWLLDEEADGKLAAEIANGTEEIG
jgi:hypothetical protein